MAYVLGLDLGTSAIKGLLVNKDGNLVAEATATYPLDTPQIGFSEQNPKHWIEAANHVMLELLEKVPDMKELLEGISFSGQMHSLVLLDEKDKPLRPAILWNDVRTTEQCKEIKEKAGELILSHTKNIALEGFTLPKILWVQKHEPEIWSKVKRIQLPKDYLRFWLTNQYHMDFSDAAGTLMLNQDTKEWDHDILSRFDIPKSILPDVVPSTKVVGFLKPELQEYYGFSRDVKIITGGADNACAAVGAGILQEGIGMCSIGTSGVFLSYEEDAKKNYQGKLHMFHHAMDDANYSMGVTLAAGNSLNWFKQNFAPNQSFGELLADINSVAIGSDGLLFAPYIVGERTPYSDSQIRGSFIGIDTHHQLKHFARSVLEGITFSLMDSKIIMEEIADKKFDRIVSVGGGAKNNDWLQMQADIFDTAVVNLTTEQGPGLGAVMLAAVGCGWFSDLNDCAARFVSYKEEIIPKAENVEKYKEVYARYRKVYEGTKEICHSYFGK
ncbi:xylulokinase [Pradoshia sp. D12]|uniref:xylulokinase n=1 Tax=Bacillaceae TaxID=186817 RepID=UPI00080AE592|nr:MULTISPECIES: xylulokinase [Bacillaceae]OCA82656.1 xylulokinase [Bacillus sp. FJAT-27986]QFK70133.1 xylulokinase [Pradoshia sp. D12]TPF70913.1 xylulokinase [Bacillus sp. D12]